MIGNDRSAQATNECAEEIKQVVDENRSRIGEFSDLVDVPFSASHSSLMAHLNTNYYHVHGAPFLRPDKADPVTIASAAGAWSEAGGIVQVIAANDIAKPFDLHFISVTEISAVLDGVIDVFAGPDLIKITSIDVSRSTNFSREQQMRIQVPQLPANWRVGCRFTDSTANAQSVKVKFQGHVYSTSL